MHKHMHIFTRLHLIQLVNVPSLCLSMMIPLVVVVKRVLNLFRLKSYTHTHTHSHTHLPPLCQAFHFCLSLCHTLKRRQNTKKQKKKQRTNTINNTHS